MAFAAILYFLALLLLALPLESLARRWRLPSSVLLVLLGFVSSELLVGLGVDTGVRWQNFNFVILQVFLPLIVFQAALRIDLRMLQANLVSILLLSLPLALVATAIIAALLYYAIGSPAGFPWIAAFIAGALLAATDPAAILSLSGSALSPKLRSLLEGESLLNDTTAILLFTMLLAVAQAGSEIRFGSLAWRFVTYLCGGLLVGGLLGLAGGQLCRLLREERAFSVVSLATAYAAFVVAEHLSHVSGVMAVLAAGLLFRWRSEDEIDVDALQRGRWLWDFVAHQVETLIFLLAGITITLGMFADRWLAMLIGIGSVLISRFAIVFGMLTPLYGLLRWPWLPGRERWLLHWGGVRGAVTLALALALPIGLDYWYTVQSIAYGVVLFTLFVQATTLSRLVRKESARSTSGQYK